MSLLSTVTYALLTTIVTSIIFLIIMSLELKDGKDVEFTYQIAKVVIGFVIPLLFFLYFFLSITILPLLHHLSQIHLL
ncbi:hypothetical protein DY052_07405 [Apilactobacillus timberlakei]|uniref:hypothetical protein n=1 Tax=Apilactobacillus timberlakei TaxID=2008380 RepID=UPI0011299F6D|nr:hypothetical protein [Apilactobacillus timberlakei]TPR13679.1 hypothetical protein DY052_07405 [Apilactobacillus timberlakei]